MRVPQVTHYLLDLQIFFEQHEVSGRGKTKVSNTTGIAITEIPFLLYRLFAVTAVADGMGKECNFTQDIVKLNDLTRQQVNHLLINLSEPLLPGATIELEICYIGELYGYPEVWPYIREKIDESYTLLREDSLAYPVLAYPSQESIRESIQSRFHYDLQVTVPEGWIVACGGRLLDVRQTDGRSTYQYQSKAPFWRMDIAIAKFAVLRDIEKDLNVFYQRGQNECCREW